MEESYVKATAPVETANDPVTADVDNPPEGVDADELPIRNVQLNDERTDDDAETESAKMKDEPEQDSEGE